MSLDKIQAGDELAQSKDIVSDNIAQLKALFPEVVAEGKIDFEALKTILGEEVETEEEYYRFTWAGKTKARQEAHKPSTGTLRPCKEESVDWENTENLYIEGDNLEVLKLLQKSYAGKIKMIYIDPPYNTGKDFVYKDNYKDNLRNYQELTGQIDGEGNRLSTNSDSDGRYHSNWLNMMYPRLRLARNLLTEDGVIFMSIDDNEVENLKKLGNEVFGESNFIGTIVWKHTQQSKNDEKHFSRQYNYNVVFSKNLAHTGKFRFERTEKDNANYANPDNDENGKWRSGDVRSPNLRTTLKYNIKTPIGTYIDSPEKGWRWSEPVIKEKIATGEIIFKKDYSGIIRKIYLKNQDGRTPENLWVGDRFGTTRIANAELKELYGQNVPFDTPKPTKLVSSMMKLFNDKSYYVLDFFSGSGTTAHAVMAINAEDGGRRKHIQVQLPEPTSEKSEAYKAGYKAITEIGKERIRRAAKKIAEENPLLAPNMDLGFKVFKLDSSNIQAWDGNPDNLEDNLFNATDNIKTDRTEEDVLYEILLKYGLDLTLPIETKAIAGKQVFSVAYGALFVCMADQITKDIAQGVGEWKEALNPAVCRAVFKDSGFSSDADKTNTVQTLKRFGITEVKAI